MPYDLGDPVGLSVTIRDAADAPTNAASVALTITLPDLSTASPTITNPPTATGVYVHDYATTQAGRHAVRWTTTGPASAFTDVFDVRPSSPGYILGLAAAKTFLRVTSSDDDEELRGFLEAITEIVERHVGRAVPVRTFVEEKPGGCALALDKHPVLSVTSMSPYLSAGISYVAADVDVSSNGIVRLKSGVDFWGPLRITYVAGSAVIPANYTLAAKVILQHLWQTQRGPAVNSARFAGDDDESSFLKANGFSVPHRAIELLGPRIGGFA